MDGFKYTMHVCMYPLLFPLFNLTLALIMVFATFALEGEGELVQPKIPLNKVRSQEGMCRTYVIFWFSRHKIIYTIHLISVEQK